RERALPARHRRGDAGARHRRGRLRAARRLERGEPHRGARARRARALPARVPGPDQHALPAGHARPRARARRRGPRARARMERAGAGAPARRAAAAGGLPAAVPRHAPPRRDGSPRHGGVRPARLRRRARLRYGDPRPVPRERLGPARVDAARGGGHAGVRAAPAAGARVWVGNWGDEGRTAELRRFLIEPVRALRLRARVYGVRYPDEARRELADAGIEYAGWLPNDQVPAAFAAFGATVHIPRRPYAEALPGIPTIRVFEALACGTPLIGSPGADGEGLSAPGADYRVARDGAERRRLLRDVLEAPALAAQLAAHGRRTVLARHTCAHRVDELLRIHAGLAANRAAEAAA